MPRSTFSPCSPKLLRRRDLVLWVGACSLTCCATVEPGLSKPGWVLPVGSIDCDAACRTPSTCPAACQPSGCSPTPGATCPKCESAGDCDDRDPCTADVCVASFCAHQYDESLCPGPNQAQRQERRLGQTTFFAHTDTTLYRVDIGVEPVGITLIGDFGNLPELEQISDLAQARDGTLYAVSFKDLYRVDPETALLVHIGPLGVDDINGLAVAPDGSIVAASNGNFTTRGRFYRVDTSTGEAQVLGPGLGQDGVASCGDIVWNTGDNALLADCDSEFSKGRLFAVSVATGNATFVGSLPYEALFGLTIADGRVFGLSGLGNIFEIDLEQGTLREMTVDPAFSGIPWWGAS